MRIAKIDDNLELDLDRITHIEGTTGSHRDRKYIVHLDSGTKINMLEDSDGFHPAMARSTLIKKWRKVGKQIPPPST